jgi:glycosyl transferase, family 25
MKLIDFFERVYIVNLPERSDRRREMEAELQRVGLSVDGRHIRYFRAIRPDSAGLFPSLGSRGCFMSHLEIMREASRDGLDNVLVMEDDLSLATSLAQSQPEMLARLQQGDWDFAYIGHVEDTPSAGLQPAWHESQVPMATTHFYGLNRAAIASVLEHLEACLTRLPGHPEGSPMHVDGAYSLFRMRHPQVKTLMAVPSLGGQRSSRSDIYPNKWYDRTPVLQQMAGLARGGKNWLGRLIQTAN